MRTLMKLTWVELKLFSREPVTMLFTFALPLIVLFILAEVFGNTPDPDGEVFRGVGPMNYYVPAYIGLVIASIGLIALPVHLAGYRERGVLRRLRASSVPDWCVFGSQMIVSLAISVSGGILLTVAAFFAYDVRLPASVGQLLLAFVLSTMSFASLGVLLGAVLPTARAAQGAGLLLFFVMMFISGGGPPREVLTQTLRDIASGLPLTYVVTLMQNAWNGFGWDGAAFLIVSAIMAAAALISLKVFRWE